MNVRKIVGLIGLFFLAVSTLPKESTAASFYEGKRITIVVCSGPGGGYDRMSRLFAKYLPTYIPGSPTIIVENMDGAAGIIAANYIYNIAKPDGLTIGSLERGTTLAYLLKREGVKFDIRKYSWIGSTAVESVVLAVRTDFPAKTFNELMNAKEVFLATSGYDSQDYQFPALLQGVLGLKNFNLIKYKNGPDALLAIERKEADGKASSYSTILPLIDRGVVRLVLRSRVSEPGIENLPVNEDFTKDQKAKTIMAMQGSLGFIGRPFMAPPGTPSEAINIIRDAFARAAKDPDLVQEAKKARMTVQFTPADECLKVVNFILDQPKDIADEFSKYIK